MTGHAASLSVKAPVWDWNKSNQTHIYFLGIQKKFTDKLLGNSSNWRHTVGLPYVVGMIPLALTHLVAVIGELAIKGVTNLFGALIPGSEFSARKGAKQLSLCFVHLLLTPTVYPIVFVTYTIVVPLLITISPDAARKLLRGY